jgi:hypothetical protein
MGCEKPIVASREKDTMKREVKMLRIPTKADTDSENNRTPIPIQSGQFSERSDARGLVIEECPM